MFIEDQSMDQKSSLAFQWMNLTETEKAGMIFHKGKHTGFYRSVIYTNESLMKMG